MKFIQKQPCRDNSAHSFTLIYKFFSPVTGYHYILRAEYHRENVFALKFYAQKDSKSDYKYSRIINKGDVYNILMTCMKAVSLILRSYPTASFGFIGARTIDQRSNRVEGYTNTQRFRIYTKIVEDTIGFATFAHFAYEEVSGYLLINLASADLDAKEQALTRMFSHTYVDLLNI